MASRILALTPLWVLLLLFAFSPEFLRTLGMRPPDAFGIPMPLAVELAALAWMVIGVVVIRHASSRLAEAIALTVFTIPATVVVVVIPAVTFVAGP